MSYSFEKKNLNSPLNPLIILATIVCIVFYALKMITQVQWFIHSCIHSDELVSQNTAVGPYKNKFVEQVW